jgi:hypothetical protein
MACPSNDCACTAEVAAPRVHAPMALMCRLNAGVRSSPSTGARLPAPNRPSRVRPGRATSFGGWRQRWASAGSVGGTQSGPQLGAQLAGHVALHVPPQLAPQLYTQLAHEPAQLS